MSLKTSFTIAATVFISSAISYPMAAKAATATFSDQTTFLSQLSTTITDTYSSPPYGATTTVYTDADMNAIFGQTTYHPTEFINSNIVGFGHYCAGCNGSFTLGFLSTSVSGPTGVFGVGFNYTNQQSPFYVAFVKFGDGSTQNYTLDSTENDFTHFFGITSDLSIASIALGLVDGGITDQGAFSIDNLTIGAELGPSTVPLPAALPLFATGLGALGLLGWRRKRKAASAIAA